MLYKGIDLTFLDDVEIFNLVLKGILPNFPPGFWCSVQEGEGKKIAVSLLKHVVEKELELSREEIISSLSKEFIRKHKLWTPCKLYYGRSPIRFIIDTYPNEFRAFEFKACRIPQGHWTIKENRVEAIKWLIEGQLEWNREDIKKSFTRDIFELYGLATLNRYYTSSWAALEEAYPGTYYPWELRSAEVPSGYWSIKENRVAALRWLIAQKENNNSSGAVDLTIEDFREHGLTTLIFNIYNKSVNAAMRELIN